MSDAFGDIDAALAAERSRGFGGIRLTSNLTARQESDRLREAAGNLLEKAYRDLHDGNEDRARTYLLKAAALPWDQHERTHPAAVDIHMVLFSEMTDTLEAAEPGDRRWLTAAQEAMGHLDEGGATELARALSSIVHDYRLPTREARLARDLIGDRATVEDDMEFGLTAASSRDEVAATIEPMLRALVAYHHALHHAD